ncbi:MAG TPA: hypothetical protein VGJ94_11710 [Syntrophorhabdaceae bacterium]
MWESHFSHPDMNYGRHILLCVFFLLFAAMSAYAQSGYSQFERDLQLSEAQRARVEETKRRYMDDLHGLNQDYVNKRLELRELDRNPSSDPDRKQRLRSELRSIENTRHNLYNQYRSDVSRALNEEQRNRYNRFVETERRRSINRPSSPPVEGYSTPPMTRVTPPEDNRPPPSSPGRAVAPPPPTLYRPTEPPSSPRSPVPPPSRGYGR